MLEQPFTTVVAGSSNRRGVAITGAFPGQGANLVINVRYAARLAAVPDPGDRVAAAAQSRCRR